MYLKAQTKASLESIIGKSLKEISDMDFDDEIRFVEKKTKKPLLFSKKIDTRMSGRGNPLITRKRIFTMQDVEKKLSELKQVMNPEIVGKVDSSFLFSYKKEQDEAFRNYLEVINPFIVQFEVLRNEFPIELQNEIRAIYGHLARASIAETPQIAAKNVEKIKSHTKRALLDCYKYSCIIFIDNYNNFFERYKNVDLTYLNQGNFLPEVTKLYKNAVNLYFEAKKLETSNTSEERQLDLYQDSYNQFVDLDKKLKAAETGASFLQHKATRKDVLAKWSFGIGVVGTLFGFISFFVG